MKAILIDVVEKTIKEVELKGDFLTNCYKLLKCRVIEVAAEIDDNTIWVDEEGYCHIPMGYFRVIGYNQIFSGNGLVVGYDRTKDENKDCSIGVEDVRDLVTFVEEVC